MATHLQKRLSSRTRDRQPLVKEKKTYDIEWITQLGQQFVNQVQKPIDIRQSLIKNTEPQRCILHNIMFSIYCTICRKVLCASCMYGNAVHRKHRVVPVQNADQQLKQDIKNFQFKITKIYNQTDSLVNSNGEFLMRVEKDFSPVILNLQQFYQNLRQLIKKKEKQQIQILKDMKEQAKMQITQYNKQLGKISQYIINKMRQYTQQHRISSQMIACRSILENLMQSANFINQSQLQLDKYKCPTDFDIIRNNFSQIEVKICNIFSIRQAVPIQSASRSKFIKNDIKRTSFVQSRVKGEIKILQKQHKRMRSSIDGTGRTIAKQ